MDKIFLSVTETGAALNLGTTTVKKLIRDGSLMSVKIGDRRLVPVTAVEALAAAVIADQAAA